MERVALVGISARTQTGPMRNDTHDVSRRTSSAFNNEICRTNCVASDRGCTRVTLSKFHGKEGVDGSSPSNQDQDERPRGKVLFIVVNVMNKTELLQVILERKMGLEPTTFCIARKPREATQSVSERHTARLRGVSGRRSVTRRQQPTPKAD
jgi:hypothetical protein